MMAHRNYTGTTEASQNAGNPFLTLRDPNAIWLSPLCGDRYSLYNAFWSPLLDVYLDSPDLTQCFQETVLNWVPNGILFLITPFYAIYLARQPLVRHKGRSLQNSASIISCALKAVLNLIMAIIALSGNDAKTFYTPSSVLALLIKFAADVICAVFFNAEFQRGFHTSYLLGPYWLVTFIINIVAVRSLDIQMLVVPVPTWYFATYIINFILNILLMLLTLFADLMAKGPVISDGYSETSPLINEQQYEFTKLSNKEDRESKENAAEQHPESPFVNATWFSRLTFFWVFPSILQGFRRPIQFYELHQLPPEDKSVNLVPKFRSYFCEDRNPERMKTTSSPGWHLFVSLHLTSILELLIAAVWRILSIFGAVVEPLILGVLINFVADPSVPFWQGIVWAIVLLFLSFLKTYGIWLWLFYAVHIGTQHKSIINSLVYKKALRLSSVAKRSTTVGEIVNLMSVDAQNIQNYQLYCFTAWSFPVKVALAIYYMYGVLGPSALSGILVLGILIPFNATYLGNRIRKQQAEVLKVKDRRIRTMAEILNGIKVLKFYAWEPPFLQRTHDIRDKELSHLLTASIYDGLSSVIFYFGPYLTSLVVFAIYVNAGEENILTAEKAFVYIAFLNMVNFEMSYIPTFITFLGTAAASFKRISKFLMLDEIQTYKNEPFFIKQQNEVLKIENASFSWDENSTVLQDINLSVKKGSLVGVVGQVGSGKSSLVAAALGEMKKNKGSCILEGQVAYVPQQAWITNATLKDNILFGKPMVPSIYRDVINACALAADLDMLPGGDMTEIGEKGINLSGGQKQRVSLARAVYQDADVYILDDPLSAVDAHVGRHIFETVIGPNGLLRHKTRILNTHGIGYLPNVDQVVVLSNGCIAEQGTYNQLIQQNGIFASLVKTFVSEENQVEEKKKPALIVRTISSHNNEDNVLDQTSERQDKPKEAENKLVTEEESDSGKVSLKEYWNYAKAGSFRFIATALFCHLGFIAAQCFKNIWLSFWSDDYLLNRTIAVNREDYRLGVYGGFGALQLVTIFIEGMTLAYAINTASRVFHTNILERILRAPMSFFDTTPQGRILNLFSKDLDTIDSNLPVYLRFLLYNTAYLIMTVVILLYAIPISAVAIIPLAIFYWILLKLAVTNMNQLKSLETMSRSKIFAHFGASIDGITSIRAYRKGQEFEDKCDKLVDDNLMAWSLRNAVKVAFALHSRTSGSLLVFCVTLIVVYYRDTISPGTAGLALSYPLQLVSFLGGFLEAYVDLESQVVSVERIESYYDVPQEAEWTTVPKRRPPMRWPEEGSVEMVNYSTRYREGLDLVLKNINCQITPAERVGIVGRTGAGKSSLTLCLYRILEAAQGHISIDGIKIGDLGLHDLRGKLGIIPQDPVIFSGSLRSNLDPFMTFSDRDIWKALENAHLSKFTSELPEGLDYEVGDNGEALSVGQRQLVCLARALLHKSKILILDEATAAVDLETDELIQATIRQQFSDCTIITIAHRINTVLDYDRIMVLEKGEIAEFDTPQRLMSDHNTIFASMVKKAGII